MHKKRVARLIGTGSYLPERILTNQELESMVETTDEWIKTRTGISERRLAHSEEFTSSMGIEAAKKALHDAQVDPQEIDLILVATCTPDYLFPSTAALIQKAIGAQRAASFDLQAACSGYLFGLSIAAAYIESGMYKKILVVASEKISAFVDYQDRNTCVLFGDGASAAVVASDGPGLLIRDVTLGTDGNHAEILILPGGGSRLPASHDTIGEKSHFIKMSGKEVFRHAVRLMETAALECIQKVGLQESQITWLVPHQANIRIIEAIAKRFDVPYEKVFRTVHKYGNTSASGVAIALDELRLGGTLKGGDNILLVAFGAGLTWGASLLTVGE